MAPNDPILAWNAFRPERMSFLSGAGGVTIVARFGAGGVALSYRVACRITDTGWAER